MTRAATTSENLLFQSIKIGGVELSGRLAKSATVETRCTEDGFITDQLIEFYEEIARGGTPLIISGASSYNRYARGVPYQISVDADDKIPGLKKLAQAVHRHQSKIFIQIYHTSRQALPEPVGRKDAQGPSSVREPTLGVKPRAMSIAEIQETIQEYALAAERCKKAGIDGVQIHASHGYLISAFLTPHTNRRKDQYGGSFENRMRLLVETYRAVRKRVGPDYPLILKLNGSDELPFRKGLGTSELVKVAQNMEGEGIDAVEITTGHYESGTTFSRARWQGFTKLLTSKGVGANFSWPRRWGMWLVAPVIDSLFNKISVYSEGFNANYARQFKAALKIPVICVGGFIQKDAMEASLQRGDSDMISVARALVADPYLYRNLQDGIKGPQCQYCNKCLALAGVKPLTCFHLEVAIQRQKMIASYAHKNRKQT
ncbi:NADH:flavin oxidoreductase [Flexibacterium corallicola]|uniref:NADH:flavin oxidoreductase n=1 Tax=Flexibacterium corallicola TaxID=3037259 RepID=UPI00286F3193|nr:NADH:flavin oxidoreductase [Pseudovibrio sp. M1P-2-3]